MNSCVWLDHSYFTFVYFIIMLTRNITRLQASFLYGKNNKVDRNQAKALFSLAKCLKKPFKIPAGQGLSRSKGEPHSRGQVLLQRRHASEGLKWHCVIKGIEKLCRIELTRQILWGKRQYHILSGPMPPAVSNNQRWTKLQDYL